jgi:hypothetical protein
LISLLRLTKNGLSLWDESGSLLSSFGLYKGSNGACYDRSIILELYNAPKQFKRDLKGCRTTIQNPRLNICVLGHPDSYIKCIQEEQAIKGDGLMQRFHMCAPEPAYLSAEEINEAKSNHCSFLKLKLISDAEAYYNTIYTEFKLLVKKCNRFNTFLRLTIFVINFFGFEFLSLFSLRN